MRESRVAIVTGSASGIGEASAYALASEGFTVVINSVTSVESGEALANRLPGASYVQADVADPDDATRLVNSTMAQHGRLDLLVNNAATTSVIPHTDLDAVTPEDWYRILGVNVVGTWQVSVAAAKSMKPGSQILNISSVAGSRPLGSSIPYAVSKAALNHLTRLLAKTLGPDIRVNAIAPGPIETSGNSRRTSEQVERTTALTPLRCAGRPTDVAAVVLGLINAHYVTGEVIHVDGGINLVSHPDVLRRDAH